MILRSAQQRVLKEPMQPRIEARPTPFTLGISTKGKRENTLLIVALVLIVVIPPFAYAQTYGAPAVSANSAESASTGLPQFEVATIKSIDTRPGVMHMTGTNVYPGGRVVVSSETLGGLIVIAFHLSYWQVSGCSSWCEKDLYDVEAKPPEKLAGGVWDLRHSLFSIEDDHLRQMLQALLMDRFQLKFHRESRTGAIYMLEKTGKTLKLLPSKAAAAKDPRDETGFSSIGWAGEWNISNTSMQDLAKFAGDNILRRPVLDKTELDGSFDFRSKTAQAESGMQDGGDVDSFLAFLNEIGLQMKSAKGPVETFTIDHAEKPSPN